MAQYETVTKLKSVLTGNLYNTINEVEEADYQFIKTTIENEFFLDEQEEQSICVSDIIAFSNQFGAETVMACLRELE